MDRTDSKRRKKCAYGGGYLTVGAYRRIDQRLKEIKPQLEGLTTRLKTAEEVATRTGFFRAIEGAELKMPWILVELSKSIPNEVMLDDIGISATNESISIRGFAFKKNLSAEQNLSKFVERLSSSDMFSDVELVQAGLGLEYSPKNFKFEITAKVKRQ